MLPQVSNQLPLPGNLTNAQLNLIVAIGTLKKSRGYARVTDLARMLNITKGSVSTGLMPLRDQKYVIEEHDSKFLNLSECGQEVFDLLYNRGKLLAAINLAHEIGEGDFRVTPDDIYILPRHGSKEFWDSLFHTYGHLLEKQEDSHV